nr:hypothetical protein CFP56_69551 [Quercus suber]
MKSDPLSATDAVAMTTKRRFRVSIVEDESFDDLIHMDMTPLESSAPLLVARNSDDRAKPTTAIRPAELNGHSSFVRHDLLESTASHARRIATGQRLTELQFLMLAAPLRAHILMRQTTDSTALLQQQQQQNPQRQSAHGGYPSPDILDTGSYTFYSGDGSVTAGWPAVDDWLDFSVLWKTNGALMNSSCRFKDRGFPDNSPAETSALLTAIDEESNATGVDARFILAVIMQESSGCVRVASTASPGSQVQNPGLMQTHNGTGTCNDDGKLQNPCPDASISQMVADGTAGTESGDGLQQCLSQADISGGEAAQYYRAARMYNSGAVDTSGDLGKGCCTHCYALGDADGQWTSATLAALATTAVDTGQWSPSSDANDNGQGLTAGRLAQELEVPEKHCVAEILVILQTASPLQAIGLEMRLQPEEERTYTKIFIVTCRSTGPYSSSARIVLRQARVLYRDLVPSSAELGIEVWHAAEFVYRILHRISVATCIKTDHFSTLT